MVVVFCAAEWKILCLHNYLLKRIHSVIPDDLAYQLALGNLDVKTREKLDDFDPNSFKVCNQAFVPAVIWLY